ncbi:MAG: transposase [Phocaeicola vulgatus]|nr:MAG: transposase [Phocaeicola vulgatus]UKI46601.1 MAG: transposase [Phocaeicola vulgatus]
MNKRFRPTMLANGETVIELLTRSKYLLSVSGEKWTDRQKNTCKKILFKMFPKIKEAYTLICSLRSVFSNKSIDRVTAKVKLHEWYQKVSACTLREVKAARDAIKYKEDEVLNYFINRSTNAHAESLNSKLKGFRAQLRGVQDLPFFMFRASMIFG